MASNGNRETITIIGVIGVIALVIGAVADALDVWDKFKPDNSDLELLEESLENAQNTEADFFTEEISEQITAPAEIIPNPPRYRITY